MLISLAEDITEGSTYKLIIIMIFFSLIDGIMDRGSRHDFLVETQKTH